ncbi:MAG: hypothetical protein JW944_04640 [Deltaproteobacteria bacterium]|nr:hypothetical protein [Deltaproteobacteria bacterium]
MIKKTWLLFLILSLALGFSWTANARLIVIGTATYNGAGANNSKGALGGGGPGASGSGESRQDAAGTYNLIYEDDQGLVWLDFSNGGGIWPIQIKWAAGLNEPEVLTCKFNPGVSVIWEGDWRLPKAVDGPRYFGYDGRTNTAGYNIRTDEMGHLFYTTLGNKAGVDSEGNRVTGNGLRNTGPFKNLRSSTYWTGNEYLHYEGVWCWSFNMSSGLLNTLALQEEGFSALAVRPARVSGI